jgi:hypothetical protein
MRISLSVQIRVIRGLDLDDYNIFISYLRRPENLLAPVRKSGLSVARARLVDPLFPQNICHEQFASWRVE